MTEWLERRMCLNGELIRFWVRQRTLRSNGIAVKSAQSEHKSIFCTSKKTCSSKSSRTSTSSSASSRVKIKAARLRVKQLGEKQQLEREEAALKQKRPEEEAALKQKRLEEEVALKQKRLEEEAALKQKALEEETCFKHKFEMLQASQQVEEAVLELQVYMNKRTEEATSRHRLSRSMLRRIRLYKVILLFLVMKVNL